MEYKRLFYVLPLVAFLGACSPKATTSTSQQYVAPQPSPRKIPVRSETTPTQASMPKATAFKMSGDYANNVAITLNSEGNLIYYPAPTDISPSSAPLQLEDGWWLNRQGISSNSVFTTYTFEEYAALPSVPSSEQLKAAIIPDARVVEMVQLPYTITDAQKNISEINLFLKNK
ncbi:MAG: hypothetical protein K2J82_05535 [Muribaculaceae bacterium]|nr:hypothetical protein [Muribaculaceae bacterium]